MRFIKETLKVQQAKNQNGWVMGSDGSIVLKEFNKRKPNGWAKGFNKGRTLKSSEGSIKGFNKGFQ